MKVIHNRGFKERLLTGAIMALIVLAMAACGGEEEVAEVEKVRPPSVNLPETPVLVTLPIKEFASEGVYTVAGVFEHSEKEMGKKIQTQGVVASREVCSTGEEEAEEEIFCPTPPHLVLVDSLDTPRQQLKVVGTLEQIRAYEDGGEPIVVEGTLQQWNDDPDPTYDKFFVDSRGLIQLSPPPAEPIEID